MEKSLERNQDVFCLGNRKGSEEQKQHFIGKSDALLDALMEKNKKVGSMLNSNAKRGQLMLINGSFDYLLFPHPTMVTVESTIIQICAIMFKLFLVKQI